uniref:NADH dehydrogenase [ubiquinone] 1 alpha subcomplex subunit 2 n=1 Tax=Anabas testudineus TaxID=64144 RepID=A0AAQ6IJC6_ANATE
MAAAVVRSLGSSLGKNLREIRVHLCQTSASSKGARDFVEQHYVTLKKSNPDFPILIRECSGVQARLWARYGESDSNWFYLEDTSVGYPIRFDCGNSSFSKGDTGTSESSVKVW